MRYANGVVRRSVFTDYVVHYLANQQKLDYNI
jgi:hypothetical protein